MSVIQQNLEKLTVVAGVATAAVTSTATSSAIDLLEYDGDVMLILDSAAGGGSSPTLDIKITESDASSGTYTDLSGATFTQVTGSASMQTLAINKDECKRYIKIVQTIGGSSPTFTFSINLVGLKKYGQKYSPPSEGFFLWHLLKISIHILLILQIPLFIVALLIKEY